MAADTVQVMMWRKNDGDTWKETGAHATLEGASLAAEALHEETGLQTCVLTWVNSQFVIKNWRP